MEWTEAAIQRTEDTSHDFDIRKNALLVDLQLYDEVKQMHKFQTNYGQYQKCTKDVRKADSDSHRSDRRNRSNRQYQQNRDDYRSSGWIYHRYPVGKRPLARDSP